MHRISSCRSGFGRAWPAFVVFACARTQLPAEERAPPPCASIDAFPEECLCPCDPQPRAPWPTSCEGPALGAPDADNLADLNAIANDETLSEHDRAMAIFAIIRNTVGPCGSPAGFAAAAKEQPWAAHVSGGSVSFFAGWTPLEFGCGSYFDVRVFPHEEGEASAYYIWNFMLEGGGLKAMDGIISADPDARISNYTLSCVGPACGVDWQTSIDECHRATER